MGYLTDLTDEQWAWIEPIFPPQEGRGRRRTVSLRRVIDALMYQDRTGCQWRYIPLDFPPSGTVRYYFDKWNDDGTMLEINQVALDVGGMTRAQAVDSAVFAAPGWRFSDIESARLKDAVRRAAGGEAVRLEIEMRGADDVLHVGEVSLKPVYDAHSRVKYLIG